ncbi:MAG: GDP-mannose 4,6-dehydratase [Bacteroidia bacterium]|nr:GDP-mannose 4,6-dehydratase [Bacteroidia bacterium]
MQNKAIIFGASGQDGIYMKELCLRKGIETIAVARSSGNDVCGSVADFALVRELIRLHKPAYIFHFAANSTTKHEALFENHETIATGTLNILESVKQYSPASKVLIVGSGVQFENRGQPISENTPFAANNAYAIARIQSVYAARYFRQIGIRVYVAYLFHHESPYRHHKHVSKMITNSILNILRGVEEKIFIGDAFVEREWGFAGDIVEGIFTLINQDDIFEAIIGTGIGHTILDFLTCCFQIAQLEIDKYVDFGKDFIPEYKRLVSNPALIHSLGWQHKVNLKNLAYLMLYSNI